MRADEPLPVAPMSDQEMLKVFQAWPDRRRAVRSARRAGFTIGRWSPVALTPGRFRADAYLAAAAGIATGEALLRALRRDFDGFFDALWAEHWRTYRYGWGAEEDFVLQLEIIWSVSDRITPKRLRRAVRSDSFARVYLAAADAARRALD